MLWNMRRYSVRAEEPLKISGPLPIKPQLYVCFSTRQKYARLEIYLQAYDQIERRLAELPYRCPEFRYHSQSGTSLKENESIHGGMILHQKVRHRLYHPRNLELTVVRLQRIDDGEDMDGIANRR
jgi:hypothetical protein